jgi:hypothetical protein
MPEWSMTILFHKEKSSFLAQTRQVLSKDRTLAAPMFTNMKEIEERGAVVMTLVGLLRANVFMTVIKMLLDALNLFVIMMLMSMI